MSTVQVVCRPVPRTAKTRSSRLPRHSLAAVRNVHTPVVPPNHALQVRMHVLSTPTVLAAGQHVLQTAATRSSQLPRHSLAGAISVLLLTVPLRDAVLARTFALLTLTVWGVGPRAAPTASTKCSPSPQPSLAEELSAVLTRARRSHVLRGKMRVLRTSTALGKYTYILLRAN
jgi:hypothetical protein